MTPTETNAGQSEVHVRGRKLDDPRTVVRGIDGIHDVARADGRWVCSCGSPGACHHVGHVLAWLEDLVA